jgi:light-regulated signal transduction histidine kinase (bacteriophytochrome)
MASSATPNGRVATGIAGLDQMTVSHELRTPLTAIYGWTRMLVTGQIRDDQRQKAIETIERNAQAQTQLVNDLLDVSRAISGKVRLDVRPMDLGEVVQSAVDSMQPAAGAKGIGLETVLDPQAGPISGDRERMQQIVWNLVSNAIKFTPKDGRVQVRLEGCQSHVEIIVSDTGLGIEAEFLPYEDGYVLMEQVSAMERRERRRICAIAVTAHSGPEDRLRALEAGFKWHLPKPVEPTELVAVVASLTGRADK